MPEKNKSKITRGIEPESKTVRKGVGLNTYKPTESSIKPKGEGEKPNVKPHTDK